MEYPPYLVLLYFHTNILETFPVGLDIDRVTLFKGDYKYTCDTILVTIGYHICFSWDALGLEEQIDTVDTHCKGILYARQILQWRLACTLTHCENDINYAVGPLATLVYQTIAERAEK